MEKLAVRESSFTSPKDIECYEEYDDDEEERN